MNRINLTIQPNLKNSITEREREVLHLIAHEHTSKEIASELYISTETVLSHRRYIMHKMNVRNVAGMVRVGMERGLVGMFVLLLLFLVTNVHAQINTVIEMPVSINEAGSAPEASAVLDINSTTQGILIPRMTTSQRLAIENPACGLMVYDVTEQSFFYRTETEWMDLRGMQGEMGAQGPIGVQGATGPQGITGPQGATGAQGDTGEQGPQGPEGPIGSQGATGANGINCWDLNSNGIADAGEDTNSDGILNALDCRGEDGSQGPQGATGPQGPAGPQGDTGPEGPQGAPGDPASLEEIMISRTGDTLFISDEIFIIIPGISEANADKGNSFKTGLAENANSDSGPE